MRPPADPGDVDWELPDFSLTERSGRAVTRQDLLGNVWVADFVFTRCSGPCPLVSTTMARLQKELAARPGVLLVSFTVDPGHDDPAVLSRYAESYGADPERWLFLTGPEGDVYRLLRDGFKVGVAMNPGQDAGNAVTHSTRLAVVDRRGHVRHFYDGAPNPANETPEDFDQNLRRLLQKVADLAHEGS
jgi:cytochrome oxidase Cu insertion factor (SCO1/SenC/PrrC family)